jgi:hypothetical protein
LLIDLDAMKAIAVQLYAPRIGQQYGTAGVDALRRLLPAVHEAHRRVAYERLSEGLVVFASLDPGDAPLDPSGSAEVPPMELTPRVQGAATLQVLTDNRLRLWPILADPVSLAERAVVYHFAGTDHFVLNGQLDAVPNPTGFPSAFGLPTFVDLDDALAFYSVNFARYSMCEILARCWHDDRRLFLTNKPEAIMRRSLARHLRSTLRGHELVETREEQNVDESHPVDIKVTWSLSNRLALIEVKWLGDSVNEDGTASQTRYRDARAREGAQQLSDYLDANIARAPQHVTQGYLVVFDARRRGLRQPGEGISESDARYYANREIEYDPDFHQIRVDFSPPSRFYLEPVT